MPGIRAYLEREAFRVRSANSDPGAVVLARTCQPDVVVLQADGTDNGLQLMSQILSEVAVPVIIVAPRDHADPVEALNHGADDYLVEPVAFPEIAARARAADPLFGAYFAHDALLCGSWPVPTEAPEVGPAAGPPSLVVGTRGDPVTPLAGSERVTTQLGSATLVTWLGAGHGAYPATPCISDAVGGYLRDGVLPQAGTVCPP